MSLRAELLKETKTEVKSIRNRRDQEIGKRHITTTEEVMIIRDKKGNIIKKLNSKDIKSADNVISILDKLEKVKS